VCVCVCVCVCLRYGKSIVCCWLVFHFTLHTTSKCCDIRRWMIREVLLTGNWQRGSLHFTVPSTGSTRHRFPLCGHLLLVSCWLFQITWDYPTLGKSWREGNRNCGTYCTTAQNIRWQNKRLGLSVVSPGTLRNT